MLRYDTVIFDLDGTLLNTLDDLAGAVNYALEKMGWPLRTTDEVRGFVGNGVKLLIDRAAPRDGGLAIDAGAVANAPDPIASRALRLLLGRLWGGDQNCGAVHLAALLKLCRGTDPSAQICLPHGTKARRAYGALLLLPRLGPIPLAEGPLPLPGVLDCGPWQISCTQEDYCGQPQGPWDLWLDRGATPMLALRSRRTGDRLTPPGRLGKTVKKWMIEERLPRFQREVLPVFHCGGQIAAVAGLGPDRTFAAREGRAAWHITILPSE